MQVSGLSYDFAEASASRGIPFMVRQRARCLPQLMLLCFRDLGWFNNWPVGLLLVFLYINSCSYILTFQWRQSTMYIVTHLLYPSVLSTWGCYAQWNKSERTIPSCVLYLRGQLMHIVIVEAGIKESVKKRGRVLSSFCLRHVYYCPIVRSTSQGYAQN